MAYKIHYTPDAELDLDDLPRQDESLVRDTLPSYLAHEPATTSRNRKQLAPNPLAAAWELRLGDLRVYYDIDEPAQRVRVLRIGRKVRERVILRGVRTDLRD